MAPSDGQPDYRSIRLGERVEMFSPGSVGYELLALVEQAENRVAEAVAAERERAARIAEEFEDYLGAGYISEFTRGHDHAAAGIAAAIREGE